MEEYIKELREIYPKELLTDEEFETAVDIENVLDRKNYIKQCLISRNDYEGPKELTGYNDAWIENLDTDVFTEEKECIYHKSTSETLIGNSTNGPLNKPVLLDAEKDGDRFLELYKTEQDMTIKERAKKWCKETFGCFLKTEATCYYQGAIDQQRIDIEKACDTFCAITCKGYQDTRGLCYCDGGCEKRNLFKQAMEE